MESACIDYPIFSVQNSTKRISQKFLDVLDLLLLPSFLGKDTNVPQARRRAPKSKWWKRGNCIRIPEKTGCHNPELM